MYYDLPERYAKWNRLSQQSISSHLACNKLVLLNGIDVLDKTTHDEKDPSDQNSVTETNKRLQHVTSTYFHTCHPNYQ